MLKRTQPSVAPSFFHYRVDELARSGVERIGCLHQRGAAGVGTKRRPTG
jgi:hypothetical protein